MEARLSIHPVLDLGFSYTMGECTAILVFLFTGIFLSWLKRYKDQNKLPLPPGPKGLPLIGNLFDKPTHLEWVRYHELCQEFETDVLYLNRAGTSYVILDTSEAATEIMERRSSISSGRATLTMLNELMGWDYNFGFGDYGDRWRKSRKLVHQSFHPTASRQFHPRILKASRNLLKRFLDYPSDILGNLRHMAGETITSTIYGIEVQAHDDPYIKAAHAALATSAQAGTPGLFLVDSFPFLKYVPEWVPGATFQRKASEWKVLCQRMVEIPYAAARDALMTGDTSASFVSVSLQKMYNGGPDDVYQEEMIRNAAATMYTGGFDTTVFAIASCILAILDNPSILEKAQMELDSVVKPGHLPDFDDEASLPYITAIAKESLRWRDSVPTALPHVLRTEQEYKGYRLPAGSVIVPNAWAMLHDEKVYPEPFRFNPDRFMKDGKLDTSVRDPSHACFGFGRRICPGRYLGFSSLWINLASLFAVFDIEKAVDEHGNIIEPDRDYIPGIICYPKPFKCRIKPRTKEREHLIQVSAAAQEF